MVVTLDLRPSLELTDEQLESICRRNPDLKFERSAQGKLVVVALTGGETGRRNTKLTARLEFWSDESGLGVVFDSSTGFRLPNGAVRSPDAAWVSNERWEGLTAEERRRWISLCPDFAVELRSDLAHDLSDEMDDLRAKMAEYLANELRLGWLIDPENGVVEIYRAGQAVEVLEQPESLSGEAVLPGLLLKLNGILG